MYCTTDGQTGGHGEGGEEELEGLVEQVGADGAAPGALRCCLGEEEVEEEEEEMEEVEKNKK